MLVVMEHRNIHHLAQLRQGGGLEYARRQGEAFAQEAEEALEGIPASDALESLTDAILDGVRNADALFDQLRAELATA